MTQQFLWLALWLGLVTGNALSAKPVVFWAPDSVEPGNVVLLYGGGLAETAHVAAGRLPDGPAEHPGFPTAPPEPRTACPAIQATDNSLKFQLPDSYAPGLFQATVQDGSSASRPVVLNRPELWFMQPMQLRPGLTQNQAPPGARVQIIGKNFLLPHDLGRPRAVLHIADGQWLELAVTNTERFSLLARLPGELATGRADLWIHNGFGGPAGWGGPLVVEIKAPDVWPDREFNVKSYGAHGDGVADDTASLRAALTAAGTNGGGIVYLPWGNYRLTNYLILPERTILRGASRDSTVLQWPVDEPHRLADFTPGAMYGISRYAVEDLTLIVRKVDTLFTGLSANTDLPPALKPLRQKASRDVFFRRVNFQHWLMCSHPDREPALWNVVTNAAGRIVKPSKFDGDGAHILRLTGVENFELSDCLAQGGQIHLRNLVNARETGNLFGNEMGYCWVELGGGAHYEVCANNEIRASASWGYGNIGMQYVYSAHNRSYNFVRGEREAMTLDISALPTASAQSNIAWFGLPSLVSGQTLTLAGIKARPDEFTGLAVMVLDGPGSGQYRTITHNTATEFTVDRPWEVPPTTGSTVGLWLLMRHMVVYKCSGSDCSAFSQLYGSFFDFTIDSCRVERNQGLWGQSGWFVRFCYNEVAYANSYHPGIGPHGNNPEGNLPFSFVGLTDGNLRITKFGSAQYGRKLVFVNDVTPHPVPGGRGIIVKANQLSYNQRVAFPPSADPRPHDDGKVRFVDVVVDDNHVAHSTTGVQVGPGARNVVLVNNQYEDVAIPHLLAKPEQVGLLGSDATP